MLRRLIFATGLLVILPTCAQGVFPYPTKAEVSGVLKESSDVLNQFDEVAAHLDIDSWNAPEAFRGRQRLLLTEAQEGLSDVRDDIETEVESVSSGNKHASAQDLLSVCTKMSQLAQFIANVSVYYSAFQTNAVYSEAVNLSELAGSAKMASIHCGGILSVLLRQTKFGSSPVIIRSPRRAPPRPLSSTLYRSNCRGTNEADVSVVCVKFEDNC